MCPLPQFVWSHCLGGNFMSINWICNNLIQSQTRRIDSMENKVHDCKRLNTGKYASTSIWEWNKKLSFWPHFSTFLHQCLAKTCKNFGKRWFGPALMPSTQMLVKIYLRCPCILGIMVGLKPSFPSPPFKQYNRKIESIRLQIKFYEGTKSFLTQPWWLGGRALVW